MSVANPALRKEVISIYKELLNLGKDYPQGFGYFRPRLHHAFMANAHLRDEDEIRKGIMRADFVRKEIEALIVTDQEGRCIKSTGVHRWLSTALVSPKRWNTRHPKATEILQQLQDRRVTFYVYDLTKKDPSRDTWELGNMPM